MRKIKDTKDIKRAATEVKSVAARAFIQLLFISSVVNGSVGSAVVSSDAGVGSVSVVLSGCVAAGAVAEGSGVVVVLSFGVLLGVVGAVDVVGVVGEVGVVGAGSVDGTVDGTVVTVLSGAWVLFCCEPVAGITLPL